jgi:hypothetical protein
VHWLWAIIELPSFGLGSREADRGFLLGLILLGIVLLLMLIGYVKYRGGW